MKKVLAGLICCAVMLSCINAFAMGEVETLCFVPELPGTYAEEGMNLFNEDAIEALIVQGWKELDDRIDFEEYKLPKEEFKEIYERIFYHNPLYYYVKGSYVTVSKGGMVIAVKPSYETQNKAEIEARLQEYQRETEEILLAVSGHMTDFEKVMAVHDYLVLDYEYDLSLSNRDISIMTTKTGVCMSYTFVFQHLMNQLDIGCTYVSSDAMDHVWNLVKVDGEWYHLDATYDDPTYNRDAMVSHDYALISTEAIKKQASPHYGFDTGKIKANSNKYDKAKWRNNTSAFAYANGTSYWLEDDDLIDENGNILVRNIAKDDRWTIQKTNQGTLFLPGFFSGLGAYNGELYYNTDEKIMKYNLQTQKTEVVLEKIGVCGLYIENNTLHYNQYDPKTKRFVEGGTILLGDICESEAWLEDGKVTIRMYNETDVDWVVYSASDTGIVHQDIQGSGIHTVSLPASGETRLFLWDKNMRPIQNVLDVE